MTARAYVALGKISLREEFRYFWSDGLLNAGIGAAFAAIISLVYIAAGPSATFGAFSGATLIWYLCLGQIAQSGQTRIVRTVSKQVQDGSIVTQLTRPYHYPFGLLATHLADVIASVLSSSILIIPLALLLTKTVSVSGAGFGAFVVLLIGAALLDFMIAASIGLIAFWTEDAKPYWWIYQKIVFLAGGLIFPLDALGGRLAEIARLSPAAYLIYHPARVAVHFTWDAFVSVLIGQALYTIAFGIIMLFVWRLAKRKVHANGG